MLDKGHVERNKGQFAVACIFFVFVNMSFLRVIHADRHRRYPGPRDSDAAVVTLFLLSILSALLALVQLLHRSSNSDPDEREKETSHILDRRHSKSAYRKYSGTATFIALLSYAISFFMIYAGASAFLWYDVPAAVAIPAILVMAIPVGLVASGTLDLLRSALH